MSELQLGLIVAGVLVVLGVYAFNRYQERQLRRRMERKFHEQRPADVLMGGEVPGRSADPEERVEPHVGMEHRDATAASVREEPVAPTAAPRIESTEAAPAAAPDAATKAVAGAASRPAASAPAVDYVCLVESVEPIPHAPLAAFVKASGMIGKSVRLQGWSIRSNEWVNLPCAAEIPLVRVQAALQLADRSGAVNRVQLSTMRDLVHQFADEVGVACDCPDIDAAAHRAVELDRFCAQVDISIGCNLLPSGAAGLSGTKLRGLLESAGFVLEPTGRFVLRSEDGEQLMAAENIDEEPLSAERLRAAPIAGIVFTMDVPRVPSGARVFDRMMELGRHLAQALDATVVDDNRAPLTEAGVKLIRQQLREVQSAMEAHGIQAGSPTAVRLFS